MARLELVCYGQSDRPLGDAAFFGEVIVQTTFQHTPQEIQEIELHKYFLSEKAGYDVGWDQAAEDWEAKYGTEFRRYHPRPNGERGGLTMLVRRLFSGPAGR